ncbi:3-oxo-tetronate 4-phosphate decarboxylase [Phreatobacter oligotrophus]|uniref:3-oxo-tetronate 4-phosphate decarboxylase n=1 Tax=Phreatobacter oligotrophus TaxID=1122261 RepID=A0A2T4Z371_9HYPH|nr:3-oxo-tetronate 4-phosphate decarboxylase [Phreatobacter oligotrophus]PTM55227.1 ribulose-5-phosphate 4-epimerase/fuculose-1-phosphate aldolase [Phreatobacter oligotrophus]
MNDEERRAREGLVRWGKSLFDRGLTPGSSGNLSVRLADGYLFTPTNSCLGFLDADRLSKLDAAGQHVGGDPPTKELPLHFAFYESRPSARAVVHLHSTHATALSCLADTDPDDAIPPITPYVVMRVGKVPVVPYTRPGSADVAPLIRAKAPDHPAILLGNHGPVVAGASLESAVFAMEELEETARLVLLTRGMAVRHLATQEIADLEATFKLRG